MAIFFACFVLAQADKFIIGVLAVPIQQSMSISDTQLGLLQGAAFAMAYAIAGLPIARLLDQGDRVRIAAICVFCWSLATIMCGMVASFAILLLFRSLTAVAEAGLAPAAMSVLSERRDRRTIARIGSLFMSGPCVGGGLALIGGGLALRWLTDSDFLFAPFSEPWRMVLLMVGVPGILLAVLLAAKGREPSRATATRQQNSLPVPSLFTLLHEIVIKQPFLRFYYLALMTFSLFLYAIVPWYTVLLVREYDLSAGTAGAYSGSVFLIMGLAGAVCSSTIASMRRDDSTRGIIVVFIIVAVTLIPIGSVLTLADTLWVSLTLYAVASFLMALIVALMNVPIQLSMPSRMQARAIALAVFVNSAISGSLAPLIVGLLSDRLHLSLGFAIAATAFTGIVASSGFLLLCLCRLSVEVVRDEN